MFPPIKVVGGGHENLGLGAYGPPLFWHQGSQGTKELLVCAVSSSLLAGQDSSRVATWSCSGTRTMFILWVKGVIPVQSQAHPRHRLGLNTSVGVQYRVEGLCQSLGLSIASYLTIHFISRYNNWYLCCLPL